MTLEKYTNVRLVALHPEASAYDAIRAMEDNHVGVVVVHDDGGVCGIVTDRDIAMQVISYELKATEVKLNTLMAKPVQVVQRGASAREAAEAMLERHVRRLPIVDGAKLVGMVTLDDLIADQVVEGDALAAIVRAQLSEPARLKRAGSLRPTTPVRPSDSFSSQRAEERQAAHARQGLENLLSRARRAVSLDAADVEVAVEIVLSRLLQRVQPAAARQLASQLPMLLRQRVGGAFVGPDRSVTRQSIERALATRFDLEGERAAQVFGEAAGVLVDAVTVGALDDFASQLPPDLAEAFTVPDHMLG